MKIFSFLTLAMFFTALSVHAQSDLRKVEFGSFTTLSLPGSVKLNLSQGEANFIEGKPADIDKLSFSVDGGVLRISGDLGSRIDLTVTGLEKILISGSAKIISKSVLKGESLMVVVNGNGSGNLHVDMSELVTMEVSGISNYVLRGNAKSFDLDLSGTGNVDARNLRVQQAEVNISGVGEAVVDVIQMLDANVSGAGKIYYVNEPALLNKNISGIGRIDNLDEKGSEAFQLKIDERGITLSSRSDEVTSDTISLHPKKVSPKWAGFELGFNTLVNSDFKTTLPEVYDYLELNTGKSIAVSFNFFDKGFDIYRKYVMGVTGLGLTYNNFRFEQDFTLRQDAPVVSTLNPLPPYTDTVTYMKNKLVASYVSIPLLLQINTSEINRKAVQFSVGVIGYYRLGSHTKRVYKEDGKRKKDKDYDDFNLNPFRLETTFRVTHRNLNIFANYSLTGIFKDGEGPDLYPFTVGLRLAGW